MSNQIGIRMRRKDLDILKQVCKARGEDVSSFVRRSVLKELARLSYLTQEEKKALGVVSKQSTRKSAEENE